MATNKTEEILELMIHSIKGKKVTVILFSIVRKTVKNSLFQEPLNYISSKIRFPVKTWQRISLIVTLHC